MTLQGFFGNFVKPFRKIFLARSPVDLRAWRHSVAGLGAAAKNGLD
jgi:hypothetical protein